MKKVFKAFSISLLVLVLSGCELRETVKNEITFIEKDTIEVDRNFNSCHLIQKVNDIEITDTMIENNEIKLPNKEVVKCNTSNAEIKTGKINFEFVYKKVNFKKEVTLVDTQSPQINSEDEFVVEEGNEYFVLSNYIDVKDNFDDEVFIGYTGSYDLNKIGEYPVEIKAIDKSENESIKKVVVKVVDKEKEIITIPNEPPKPSENNTNNGSNNNGGSNAGNGGSKPQPNPTPQPKPNNSGYKAQNKDFLFSEGYDKNSGFQACKNYLNAEMDKGHIGSGSCDPIQESGVYKGFRATFR